MSVNILRFVLFWAFCFLATTKVLVKGEESNNAGLAVAANDKVTVAELDLSDADIEHLKRFDEQIDSMPDTMEASYFEREGKSFKDTNLRKAAEALTDEEITEIIKSITFPNEENITEDSESHMKPASALPSDVEPRTSGQRQGRGYYIVAFTPEEISPARNSVPYARLQIIPAERSVNGDDPSPDMRMVSSKSWNKYINSLMRQIRRGTRKIQRKTRVKGSKKESTLENFLKDMYQMTIKQSSKKKKKSSWNLW